MGDILLPALDPAGIVGFFIHMFSVIIGGFFTIPSGGFLEIILWIWDIFIFLAATKWVIESKNAIEGALHFFIYLSFYSIAFSIHNLFIGPVLIVAFISLFDIHGVFKKEVTVPILLLVLLIPKDNPLLYILSLTVFIVLTAFFVMGVLFPPPKE
ncbi:MAG: hypothetical protein HY917_00445 [Candidatus Diapherotrites archaeon]|nr:hypothetical protein [Candidatus Diapherotrites archaeon]